MDLDFSSFLGGGGSSGGGGGNTGGGGSGPASGKGSSFSTATIADNVTRGLDGHTLVLVAAVIGAVLLVVGLAAINLFKK